MPRSTRSHTLALDQNNVVGFSLGNLHRTILEIELIKWNVNDSIH